MVVGGPLYLHESGQRSLILTGWFHRACMENNGCLSLWFLKPFLYRAAQLWQEGEHVPHPWPNTGHTTCPDSKGTHQQFRVERSQVMGGLGAMTLCLDSQILKDEFTQYWKFSYYLVTLKMTENRYKTFLILASHMWYLLVFFDGSKMNNFKLGIVVKTLGLLNKSYFHHHRNMNMCDKHIAKDCLTRDE